MTMRYHSNYFALVLVVSQLPMQSGALADEIKATFNCKAGKTIVATFSANAVKLKLSDGRSLTVPQAVSGSGARYANTDESFVFWNKGDTAFITEGKAKKETFSSCTAK
jgi:membrane-bound inhibitor of C-type lysozyme